MLKSFLIEWAKAKSAADNADKYTEFAFRGRKIGVSVTTLQNNKKFITYIVCDINSIIERRHSGRFEKVDLAMEILQALENNPEHEALDKARIEAQRMAYVQADINHRVKKLEITNFSKDEIEIIKNLMMETYLRRNSSYWDEYTIDVLIRYHVELSCRAEKGGPVDETKLRRQYLQISRILPTDTELASCGKVYRDNYGNIMVSKSACNQWFLAKHEDITENVRQMREMYSDIFRRCVSRSKFTHVLMFLAAYYKQKTGCTREMILANVKKILDRRKESTFRDKMPVDGITASDLNPNDII